MFDGSLARQIADTMDAMGISAPGVVYDTSSSPWQADSPHESIVNVSKASEHSSSNPFDKFGGALASVAKHVTSATETAVTKPFEIGASNAKKAVEGSMWLGQKANQALSTMVIEGSHASAGTGNPFAQIGNMFSAEDWGKAWSIARHQNIGQSIAYALGTGESSDPFSLGVNAVQTKNGATDFQGPFRQTVGRDHPWTRTAAGIGDFATMWYLDPTVVTGKFAGAYRANRLMHSLNVEDVVGMEQRLNETGAGAVKIHGIVPFTSKSGESAPIADWYKHIDGDNFLGRPLDSAELHASSRTLRNTPEGRTIAELYVQARKLTETDPAARTTLYNRITAIVAGDPDAAKALLSQESAAQKSIADALLNMKSGTVGKLELQALRPDTAAGPDLNAEFERQLANLDANGDVSKFVSEWAGRQTAASRLNQDILAHQGVGSYLPGVHDISKTGALKALNETRIVDKTARVHDAAIEAARKLANRPSTSVYQRSLNQMPLMVARTAGPFASLLTKAPRNVADSLRQIHYTGDINIHDWGTANQQFDSFMRLTGIDAATRIKNLSAANAARTEVEKRAVITHIENQGVESLVNRYAARGVTDENGDPISREYVLDLIRRGNAGKASSLTQAHGRAYGAAELPQDQVDSMLLRKQSMANIQDAVTRENSASKFSAKPAPDVKWRVDQISDEMGHPVALPLLETQLSNHIPMIDIEHATRVLKRDAVTAHLRGLGDAYKANLDEIGRLQGKLLSAQGHDYERLANRIDSLGKMQDSLLDAGTAATRFWKMSVLFRLGYPIRVLMDDHLRIAAKLGTAFYLSNGKEVGANWWDNVAPNWLNSTGRRAEATRAYQAAKGELAGLKLAYGHDAPHSDEDFAAIKAAAKTVMSRRPAADELAAAQETLSRLDPEGHISSHYQMQAEVDRLQASLKSHRGHLGRQQAALEAAQQKVTLGLDARGEVSAAQQALASHGQQIADKEAAIELLHSQMRSETPDEIRLQLKALSERVAKGGKEFLPPKLKIGQREIDLEGTDLKAPGAFAGTGGRVAQKQVDSNPSFAAGLMVNNEQRLYERLAGHGFYGIVAPTSNGTATPGHIHLWAQVLNHQVANSKAAMFFVRNPEATPEEFATWLKKASNDDLRTRMMASYAWDPQDWGGRIKALIDDYVPNEKVRKAVLDGYVTPKKLDAAVPEAANRPHVHGQIMDINTGRSSAVRQAADNVRNIFTWLSETPTDRLSRHPLFNAIYKSEVAKGVEVRKLAAAKNGDALTAEDIQAVARAARQKALHYVRTTLWDITSHSHAAHVLRFLSPFFAAHQEGLTRWWGIAKNDPSVIRHFTMAFDAPRQMGIVVNTQTGEIVKPDASGPDMSGHHSILLQFPEGVGLDWANKAFRDVGGGKPWAVNENAFNVILQGGVFNPGVGPLVTVPVNQLAQKYADHSAIAKVAAVLDPYPQPGLLNTVEPASLSKLVALAMGATGQGQHNAIFARYYHQNISDAMVKFKLDNGRNPTTSEFDKMKSDAGRETLGDLFRMALSNVASPAPAKPESRYSAIQHGWRQIQEAAVAQGKDFQWANDQFKAKYGDAYMALTTSDSTNPVGLTGSPAEFSAVKRYRSLLNNIDPKVMQMVIGPANAMAPKDQREYSTYARAALASTDMSQYSASKGTFFGNKDLEAAALAPMISEGWNQYAILNDQLDQIAQAVGKTSWNEVPELQAIRSKKIAQLSAQNFAWGDAYAANQSAGNFTKYLEDMHRIASYKPLANDPVRSDIGVLKRYLTLRDQVDQILAALKEQGGSGSAEAKSNAPLMALFKKKVDQLNESNTYFKNYYYNGVIENDPYVKAGVTALAGVGSAQ